MRIIPAALLFVACSSPAPHTAQSELQARLKYSSGDCLRMCPAGQYLEPIEPQSSHILEDCCKDSDGLGWGSCAWNACGRREDCRRASVARILSGPTCGGDGYKPCGS